MSAGDLSLPNPVASEQAVIGAVIVSGGEVLDELDLTPDDFLATAYAVAYREALRLHGDGHPVDVFTLTDAVPEQYRPAVFESTNHVVTAANVDFYAALVAEASLRRRTMQAGQAIVQMGSDPDADAATLLDEARGLLDRLHAAGATTAVPTMGESFDEILVEMAQTVEAVATPWSEVNSLLEGGIAPGRFYVIGARPGIGKSAVALQLAWELSRGGGKVLFSSLEMARKEVALRVIAQQTQVPFRNLMRNDLAPFMHDRMMAWRGANPLTIAIDDRAGVSVFDIRAKARAMHRQAPLAGVVVDYLQLMSDPRDLPRHEKVAEMTRALKLLSRELNVPVIACSQLNRESGKRADSTPTLSDLRESGSIEQDADVVMFLDRDATIGGDAGTPSSELALILAKNRQGRQGVAWVQWQGEFVRAVG